MSIDCADIVEHVSGLLEAAGYCFHNGDADTGHTTDDESDDWWFTWSRPGGSHDVEVGQTMATSLGALSDALDHWFSNAVIPTN